MRSAVAAGAALLVAVLAAAPSGAADGPATRRNVGGQSPEAAERQWELFRENVRRFTAGEPLLCVVDKGKGY